MYLGVNSLRLHSKSIPMGIMSRGGICLPVTPGLHSAYRKCNFDYGWQWQLGQVMTGIL